MDYLLPYKKIEYTTSLQINEIQDLLKKDVKEKKSFLENSDSLFSGVVNEAGFELSKNIQYRNSFNPIVIGKFYPERNGTRIEIKIVLHKFVMVFMFIWLSGTLCFFPMFLAGYFLMRYSFKKEAESLHQYFDKLFKENLSIDKEDPFSRF